MGCSPTHNLNCKFKRHYTHPTIESLETKLKFSITEIKSAFKQINTILTQYAHSILIHKRRLEPQHFVGTLQDPLLDHKA